MWNIVQKLQMRKKWQRKRQKNLQCKKGLRGLQKM